MINHPVHRSQLANGITVLTIANPTADIVSGRFFIPAGSRWETPQQAGLAQLLTSVLMKGTERLSALEIADRVESVGAGLGAETTTDYIKLSLKTVKSDLVGCYRHTEVLKSAEK